KELAGKVPRLVRREEKVRGRLHRHREKHHAVEFRTDYQLTFGCTRLHFQSLNTLSKTRSNAIGPRLIIKSIANTHSIPSSTSSKSYRKANATETRPMRYHATNIISSPA